MSTQKTKGLVVGKMVCDGDMDSVIVEGGGGGGVLRWLTALPTWGLI